MTDRHNFLWLTLFAVSMAFLESAVVVYLRQIYYPNGFDFPLAEIDPPVYLIEVGREAATILMLAAVARLAAVSPWTRFACFAFLFGVWDIWYYIWLKVFLNWPVSLLSWDVLFLIPVVWIGPVLAPVLVSLLLIGGSVSALLQIEGGTALRVEGRDWATAASGVLLILYTFVADALTLVVSEGVDAMLTFVPTYYNWPEYKSKHSKTR